MKNKDAKAWFTFGLFCLLNCCSFFIFRTSKKPQRAMRCSNGNIHKKPKRATKSHDEQQKAMTSNKRHSPDLVFEIELIISQKQERATTSSKRKRMANGNTHQKPKRATKSNKEHFSFPFSFIRTNSGPMEGG